MTLRTAMKHTHSLGLIVVAAVLCGALTPRGSATLEFDALIEPYRIIEVASGADGIIEEITVERGDYIAQGQVLARIDSAVELAQLEVARARAESKAGVDSARAQVELDAARLRRFEDLYEDSFVSLGAIEELRTTLKISEYALIASEEARLLASKEEARAQALFDQRTISAPFAGVVVERYLSPGELVYRANEGRILRVAQTDPLRVEVIAPASIAKTVRVGQRANILLDSATGGQLQATVTVVDPVIDAASGTLGVRLELPNPDRSITAGSRCRVVFEDAAD